MVVGEKAELCRSFCEHLLDVEGLSVWGSPGDSVLF